MFITFQPFLDLVRWPLREGAARPQGHAGGPAPFAEPPPAFYGGAREVKGVSLSTSFFGHPVFFNLGRLFWGLVCSFIDWATPFVDLVLFQPWASPFQHGLLVSNLGRSLFNLINLY